MNKGIRTKLRKTVPLWVVILIIIAVASIAVAITITELPEEHISLWSGTTAPSNFTIQDQIVQFHGPNRVVIELTLQNNNAKPSSADVTVFIENSGGNNIMNETQPTGPVPGAGAPGPGGNTVQLNFDFVSPGISSEYASDFVEIIDQPA